MAIIEIQFREDVFFNILRAQIYRAELQRELFPELGPDRLIERIEPGQVDFDNQSDGVLVFKIPFDLHHTSFADARAAGSLQSPITQKIPCVVWVKLTGQGPPAKLTWSIDHLDVSGQFRPILPGQGGDFPLGDLGIDVQDLELVYGAGVVALRFGTSLSDSQRGLSPVVNRLDGADWGQFIEGQVFADQLANQMNQAAQDAVSGSSDPPLRIDSLATGLWSSDPPAALAAVDITAVGAMPVIKTNVPISITSGTEITTDMVLLKLVLRTTIKWQAVDIITLGSHGVITAIQNAVTDAILNKLKAPPGQEEVERTDEHVVYRSSRDIVQPKTPLFTTSVLQAVIDGNGLRATGSVKVFPPPVASFTLENQHWSAGIGCHPPGWHVEFHPPLVDIFCPDRFFDLKIRSNPVVDPVGFWTPSVTWSGVGPGTQVAHIVFEPPPPMKPPKAGAVSSGYIDTNLGVRWVDLGAVPAQPPPPADPTALKGAAISECYAISDRWGMGVLNLGWHVDPPDLDLGLAHLREWTIVAEGIVDMDHIELAAVGRRGEHHLASPVVEHGVVFAQVVTEADEILQIRRGVRMLSAPPQVLQRWIVPWLRIPVGPRTVPLALSEGTLWVADSGSLAQIELPGYAHVNSGTEARLNIRHVSLSDIPVRLAAHLSSGLDGWGTALPRTVDRGRTVAVLHRGAIMLGLAGPLIQATQAAGHNKQEHMHRRAE